MNQIVKIFINNLVVRRVAFIHLMIVFLCGLGGVVFSINVLTIASSNELSWENISNGIEVFPAYSEALIVNHNENQFLFSIGGRTSSTIISRVISAEINRKGLNGGWIYHEPISPTWYHSAATVRDLIFVVGGLDIQQQPVEYILCAKLEPNGTINRWDRIELPYRIANHEVVILRDRLYIIGGYKISNTTSLFTSDVVSALVGKDCHSKLDWQTEPSLEFGVSNHSVVAITLENGVQYIYSIGGISENGLINKIQRAELLATSTFNESISDWEIVEKPEGIQIGQSLDTVIIENELHLLGGTYTDDASVSSDDAYRAVITDNGDLIDWITGKLIVPNHGQSVVVSQFGEIYTLGGKSDSDFQEMIFYTPLAWITKASNLTEEVFAGDEITYTIHYTNNGLRPLTNLIITDEIPTNTILIRPEYEPDTRIITRVIPTLGLNESGSISFTVQVVPRLTAVPPTLSTATATPTIPGMDSGLTCSTGWSGGGGTPRPTCTPTATPLPVETTPAPTATPRPSTTRIFGLTPIPVLNQAWMCEASWCIQSNPVFNAPYHFYLPIVVR